MTTTATPITRRASTRAWFRAIRPRQWVKNLLVFAAPGSAGVLLVGTTLPRTILAFGLLSAVASATYLINDVLDVEADRKHPTKRNRPIAAGLIDPRAAVAVAGGMGIVSFTIALSLGRFFVVILGAYLVTTVSYSMWLKHVPVIEIMTLSTGFVLRGLAGAAAVDVGISSWFFVVTTFGALFMVSGKRLAELNETADIAGTRAVIALYNDGFLRYVRSVSSGAAILAYTLWAFERAVQVDTIVPFFQLSIIPFTTGFLHYALLLEKGQGGAPEDVVLGDRVLQFVGLAWLALFTLGIATIS